VAFGGPVSAFRNREIKPARARADRKGQLAQWRSQSHTDLLRGGLRGKRRTRA
jgi:hypothetical protein